MSPDDGFHGFPGWFVAIFVLFVLIGIVAVIWQVFTARKMAKEAGLDPGRARMMTLLSKDGLDATYLASTLASRSRSDTREPAAPQRSTEQRLGELQQLRDSGVISAEEYQQRRREILGSI